jgi:hypothetical protein
VIGKPALLRSKLILWIVNGKGDSSRAVIESRNQELQIYRDKGDNQDARRKLSFLLIPLISMRCSALLIVTYANRFDIRVVVVWNDQI